MTIIIYKVCIMILLSSLAAVRNANATENAVAAVVLVASGKKKKKSER